MEPKTRALIIGVTGCVGAELARRLARQGIGAVGLVRRSNARGQFADTPGVELEVLERWDVDTLRARFEHLRPKIIFNLAAAGVSDGAVDPQALLEANVALPANVLLASAQAGMIPVVQTGSCFEYAPAAGLERLTESHPLAPFSLYGATKAAASLLSQAIAQKLEVPFVLLRLFGVYGPGEAPSRLVPYLFDRLIRGEVVELTSGAQVRDLIHVADAAHALQLAAEHLHELNGTGPFNVCSGIGVSVREVATTLAQLMQRPLELLRFGARPTRENEPGRIVGCGERFFQSVHWRPQLDLRTGLQRTIRELTQSKAQSQSATIP